MPKWTVFNKNIVNSKVISILFITNVLIIIINNFIICWLHINDTYSYPKQVDKKHVVLYEIQGPQHHQWNWEEFANFSNSI